MNAKRWQCEHASALCPRGTGAPSRKSCKHCGGRLRVDVGIWGVFVWTGNGHYPRAAALATFVSKIRAERYASAHDEAVVRFIVARAED